MKNAQKKLPISDPPPPSGNRRLFGEVRLQKLAEIQNLLKEVATADTHEKRGRALDKVTRIVDRLCQAAQKSTD